MRILLVEDDTMLGASTRGALQHAGYAVDWMQTGDDALAALAAHNYDAALLDLGLPSLDGIDVLRAARAKLNTTPVIIVTARDAPKQRIEGLDAGADDYVTKPYDLDELLARIRSAIRRDQGRASNVLVAQGVMFDLNDRTVTKAGAQIPLTAKEIKALAKLMGNAGRFTSKAELESALYTFDDEIESNTIETTIYALRRKLGQHFIVTARGLGYMVPK